MEMMESCMDMMGSGSMLGAMLLAVLFVLLFFGAGLALLAAL